MHHKSNLSLMKQMPPRKSKELHKQRLSASVSPSTFKWVKESVEKYSYRSEAHLIEDAIIKLKKEKEGGKEE